MATRLVRCALGEVNCAYLTDAVTNRREESVGQKQKMRQLEELRQRQRYVRTCIEEEP